MLCVDDVWSYEEGVLKHLVVKDALRLACTSKYFERVVLEQCNMCRHLKHISSDEIAAVTNLKIFPSLKSFKYLRLNGQMDVVTLRRLLSRWNDWSSCYITTSGHSRKAFIMWLTRIRGVESLVLDIHSHDAYRMVKLKNALQSFVRRNNGLTHLKLNGFVLASAITPFLKLQLRELHITALLKSCSELDFIIASLPHTMERLVVRNIFTPHYMTSDPYFLSVLGRASHIKEICLLNCYDPCVVSSIFWDSMQYFCEHTQAHTISFSIMRACDVEILLRRRLPVLKTCIAGVPLEHHDCWRKTIPKTWQVYLV
jgi:hypothetical protein